MSLPLKINVTSKGLVRMLKFAPSTLVGDAINQIQNSTQEGGEDYGLFQPAIAGVKISKWLREDKNLGNYDLQSGDELHYKRKHRPLKVRLLDESVKTILINDTNTVEEIVLVIGEKLSIGTAEDFSLKLDGSEEWLTQTKPLHEQGVSDDAILLFRKKFYNQKENFSLEDPVSLNLVYVECRDAILSGNYPCTQSEAVVFAALQAQIVLGNWVRERKVEYKDYLPIQYHKHQKKLEPLIVEEYKRTGTGMKPDVAKYKYAQLCRSLKTYGITFFSVKMNTKVKKSVKVRLGVTREGVLIADEDGGDTVKEFKFSQLRRWAAAPTNLTIDFGDHDDEYMLLQTEQAEEISKLLAGYIDLLLKKNFSNSMSKDDDDTRIAMEEPVPHMKSTGISSISTSLIGSFQGYGAGTNHGGGYGMNAQKGPGLGGAQRAAPTNLSSALGFINALGSDFTNRGTVIPRNAAVSQEEWKKQLFNNIGSLSKTLGLLMGVLPPNRFDRNGADARSVELANGMSGFVSAARNAAMRRDGIEDAEMVKSTIAVIDALRNMMEAVNELANDPNNPLLAQKLLRSQKAVEAAMAYMASASRGIMVDDSSRSLFLEASRGVGNAAKDLFGICETHSAQMRDPSNKNSMLSAGNRLKGLGDILLLEAMALAPAINSPAVQNSFKALTTDIRETANAMRGHAGQFDENSPMGFGMRTLAEAVSQLLSTANLAEVATTGRILAGPAGIIFDQTSRLMGSHGKPDAIKDAANQIANASHRLVTAAKGRATEVDDSSASHLLSGAKSIQEFSLALQKAASVASTNYNDERAQQMMDDAAQRLADSVANLVGETAEKAALHNLRSNAKLVAGATIGLVSASRSSAITCYDSSTQQNLRMNSNNAADATRRLLQAIHDVQANPNDSNAQEVFVRESQECQAQYKLVSAAMKSIPQIKDTNNKTQLKSCADNTSQALAKLFLAHKSLLASRGMTEVDEALDMATSESVGLDRALNDVESGIPVDYNTSADGALQLLAHACKELGNAGEMMIRTAQNDSNNLGPFSKKFATALGNVGNGAKALIRTNKDRNFQRAVLGCAKDASVAAKEHIEKAKDLSINPGDRFLVKAANESQKKLGEALQNLLSSAQGGSSGGQDCEDAEISIQNALSALVAKRGQAKDFPLNSEDLENAIKATQNAAHSLHSAAKSNPKALGPSAKSAASVVPSLVSAASAAAGTAPNPQLGSDLIQSTQQAITSLVGLVSASRDVAMQRDNNTLSQLDHASSHLSEALDNLLFVLNAASSGQKGADEAIKSLNQLFSSIGMKKSGSFDPQSNLVDLKRSAAKLGEIVRNVVQSARQDPEKLGSLSKDAASTLSNIVNAAEGIASSGDALKGNKLLTAAKEITQNTTGMVTASKEVIKKPLEQSSQNELTTQARNVGISIKSLLDAAKALAEADLDGFIEKIGTAAADLDSAAISAAVGLLENIAPSGTLTQSLEAEIVKQAQEMVSKVKNLLTSLKDTPSALTEAARSTCELICELANTSKMSCGTLHDSVKQQEGLGLAKAAVDSVYQLMIACKGGDQRGIIDSAKSTNTALAQLVLSLKGGVKASKECDEAMKAIAEAGSLLSGSPKRSSKSYADSQKELVEIAKDLVSGISTVVQTSKDTPSEVGTSSKGVASIITKFVHSILEASGSMTDQKAKADLIESSKNVVGSSSKIIQAAKQVSADPKNNKNVQAISNTYKEVTDTISNLIASIKAGATGEIKCEQSLDSITKSIAFLDQAAMSSATVGLQPETEDLDIDNIQASLLQFIKEVEVSNNAVAKASNVDDLGKVAEQTSNFYENIAKDSKNASSLMTSPMNQQELLMGAKAVGNAERTLISIAVRIQKGDPSARSELQQALSSVQHTLKEFAQLASNVAEAASSGFKELEVNRKIVRQIADDFSKHPLNAQSGAMEMLRAAKGLVDSVSTIGSGLSSDEGAKVAQGANETGTNAKNLASNSKGVVRLVSNPQQGKSITESSRKVIRATADFLDAAKQHRISQTPDTQFSVSETTELIMKAIAELVEASKVLPGSEEALKLFQQKDELESLAEKELNNCAAAIEEAARTLLDAKRRQAEARKNRETPLPDEDISDAILEAAQAIAQATGLLVGAATLSQKELSSKGKGPQSQSVYKKDPAWAKGLISAAQEVAGTVRALVAAANQVTKGVIEQENLIAAAKGVNASTVRLLFASKAKSDPNSPSQKKLGEASKAVSVATESLVTAAQPKNNSTQDNGPDWSNFTTLQAIRQEREDQERISALERALEDEIKGLIGNRTKEYKNANTNIAAEQAKTRGIQQPSLPGRPQPTPPPVGAKSSVAPSGRPLPSPSSADGTFTLIQLQKRPPPLGTDVKNLESYLSNAEFETVFGMTKESFSKLPTFKKNSEKQKHNLF